MMSEEHNDLHEYRIGKLEEAVSEIAESYGQIRDIIVQWGVERKIVMRIAGAIWSVAGLAVASAAVKVLVG